MQEAEWNPPLFDLHNRIQSAALYISPGMASHSPQKAAGVLVLQ